MPPRHTPKGRSKGSGPFVQLHWFMLDSEAWRHLTPAARSVYLEVARAYRGSNNGFLGLSARTAAERCRINKDTACRALQELQDLGFIVCAMRGGFSRKVRHASEWRLTTEKCDRTGETATKAFMRWRPEPTPQRNSRSEKKAVAVPYLRTVGGSNAA